MGSAKAERHRERRGDKEAHPLGQDAQWGGGRGLCFSTLGGSRQEAVLPLPGGKLDRVQERARPCLSLRRSLGHTHPSASARSRKKQHTRPRVLRNTTCQQRRKHLTHHHLQGMLNYEPTSSLMKATRDMAGRPEAVSFFRSDGGGGGGRSTGACTHTQPRSNCEPGQGLAIQHCQFALVGGRDLPQGSSLAPLRRL